MNRWTRRYHASGSTLQLQNRGAVAIGSSQRHREFKDEPLKHLGSGSDSETWTPSLLLCGSVIEGSFLTSMTLRVEFLHKLYGSAALCRMVLPKWCHAHVLNFCTGPTAVKRSPRFHERMPLSLFAGFAVAQTT
jgi:hypothetical protein